MAPLLLPSTWGIWYLRPAQWPWHWMEDIGKQYNTSSILHEAWFVHYFIAICKLKQELSPGDAEIGAKWSIFGPCDLVIERITLNNAGWYLISSEAGHNTPACQIWCHFFHAFSLKCPETPISLSFLATRGQNWTNIGQNLKVVMIHLYVKSEAISPVRSPWNAQKPQFH